MGIDEESYIREGGQGKHDNRRHLEEYLTLATIPVGYGATGPTGPSGAAGSVGESGATGSVGSTGATGAAPPNVVLDSDLPPFLNDLHGATGPGANAGDLFFVFSLNDPGYYQEKRSDLISAGATGATGPQGPTGPVGATGAVPSNVVTDDELPPYLDDIGVTGPGPDPNDLFFLFSAGGGYYQQKRSGIVSGGSTGPTGPTGPVGATGPGGEGSLGATGATGPSGAVGHTGATGPTGNGATGATGPSGAAGSVGATGATGAGSILTPYEPTSYPLNVTHPGGYGTVFSGLINGTPSANSVVYDNASGDSFPIDGAGAGRVILYNRTRGSTRIVTAHNPSTHTFTTISSTDSWADNDSIDCLSTELGSSYDDYFITLDISNVVPSAAIAFIISIKVIASSLSSYHKIYLHPWATFNSGSERLAVVSGGSGNMDQDYIVKNYSRKICLKIVGDSGATITVAVRGWWT